MTRGIWYDYMYEKKHLVQGKKLWMGLVSEHLARMDNSHHLCWILDLQTSKNTYSRYCPCYNSPYFYLL